MRDVFQGRFKTGSQGTASTLATNGFKCKVLELPWHDNQRQISCIPSGVYDVEIVRSPHFGLVYGIRNVRGRGNILQHWGNLAGDKPPYLTHSNGCQLLGKSFGYIEGQLAVLNSVTTVREFMKFMEYKPYRLHILGEL